MSSRKKKKSSKKSRTRSNTTKNRSSNAKSRGSNDSARQRAATDIRNTYPETKSNAEAQIVKQYKSKRGGRTSMMVAPGHASKTLSSMARSQDASIQKIKNKARNEQANSKRQAAEKAKLAKKRAEALATKQQRAKGDSIRQKRIEEQKKNSCLSQG